MEEVRETRDVKASSHQSIVIVLSSRFLPYLNFTQIVVLGKTFLILSAHSTKTIFDGLSRIFSIPTTDSSLSFFILYASMWNILLKNLLFILNLLRIKNVGLVIFLLTPIDLVRDFINVVLPAPSSPVNPTTSAFFPGFLFLRVFAKSFATALVSLSLFVLYWLTVPVFSS